MKYTNSIALLGLMLAVLISPVEGLEFSWLKETEAYAYQEESSVDNNMDLAFGDTVYVLMYNPTVVKIKDGFGDVREKRVQNSTLLITSATTTDAAAKREHESKFMHRVPHIDMFNHAQLQINNLIDVADDHTPKIKNILEKDIPGILEDIGKNNALAKTNGDSISSNSKDISVIKGAIDITEKDLQSLQEKHDILVGCFKDESNYTQARNCIKEFL